MKIKLLIFFVFVFLNSYAGVKKITPTKLFIISIGINNYSPSFLLNGCVSDSKSIENKIINDYKNLFKDHPDDLGEVHSFLLKAHPGDSGEVHSFLLNDTKATSYAIRNAFDSVSRNARPSDYFILYFAGFTFESETGETFLIPYLKNQISFDSIFYSSEIISTNLLSKWMEAIECKNQLVISESGNGKYFALNLIHQLFEQNPILASDNSRNRVIITTNSVGFDNFICHNSVDSGNGPLAYFLLQTQNIFNVFSEINNYEFELLNIELDCNPFNGRLVYTKIYQEKDFNDLLVKQKAESLNRGAGVLYSENAETEKTTNEPVNYALIIAADKYIGKPDWKDLKNPIHDADAIGNILKNKFGCQVKTVYNQPKDSILQAIKVYKRNLRENDNFLLFIAGHGFYDDDMSDGFVVLSDSKALNNDISRESYLQMASLNRFLDNIPAKSVFVIFDICFGASFDFKTKDLVLSDYDETISDISIDTLIQRKKEYFSRIYIASGKGEVPDYWSNTLNHSPFADKLIDILESEESFITPGKIFINLERNITEPALKEFGQHETRGDFILKVK